MVFAVVFFLNAAANFLFGVVLSAILGPAEYGRYATIALAATTLGGAAFDWLRLSSLRFSGDQEGRERIAASLDLGYLVLIGLLYLGVVVAMGLGLRFGLSATQCLLLPLLAVALTRLDYAGAQFRAREQARAFVKLFGGRQALTLTICVAVAYVTHDSTYTIGSIAIANLIPMMFVMSELRTPGSKLSHASRDSLTRFFLYAKPIVISLVIYQVILLINRQAALGHLGADATGKLSLATDLGLRMFLAINTLPEMLLFQYALRLDREQGRAAAERQISVNVVLVLGFLAPLTAGYMALAPTFEKLIVPLAYRGSFADLTLELAPGFLAYCAISSTVNPVLQLAKRTWPLTIAALVALAADILQLTFFGAGETIHSLAIAYSVSLIIGFLVAAALALRNRAIRPKIRDLAVIVAATAAMSAVVRPLNGVVNSPVLCALIAVAAGALCYGAIVLAFDVGGVRAMVLERIRSRRAGALSSLA